MRTTYMYEDLKLQKFISEYPADFIPKDGRIFVGVDYAAEGSDCTVKGFRDKNGVIHIQEVECSK